MDEVVFGRYVLQSLIGEGGMGKVYKAHDTLIDRDVAIKVLLGELSSEPGYQERFRREAHTAARLSEPHIVPIYDTGEIDGQLYLVMPVIKGTDVQALLQRQGPMSPERAVLVIEQLAAALDAAHAVGLVHRDIKPSNALVTERDFVYLIDFGVAHDASASKLTNTGMIVGTMAYMAPERFTTGVSDARSDVYALACVLHECLTGVQPYPGKSMEQQIAGHLTMDPPEPSAQRPELPAELDRVVAAGMAKDPAQRYQTASDLATAAKLALTGSQSASTRVTNLPDATQLATPVPPTVNFAQHNLPQQNYQQQNLQQPVGPPGPPPPPLHFQQPVGPPGPGPNKSSKFPLWAALTALGGALTILIVVIVIALNVNTNRGTATSPNPTYTPGYSSTPTPSSAPSYSSSPTYVPPYTPTYTTTEVPTTTPPPDHYVAIATSPPDGWGWAESTVSMEDAKNAAMAKCNSVNKNCSLRAWNRNGCVAVVTGNGFLQGGFGATEAAAEQDALTKNHGGKVLAHACTSS